MGGRAPFLRPPAHPGPRTHVAVLHASDVRAQPAVGGGQDLLHARLQFIETNREAREIIHLGSRHRNRGYKWRSLLRTLPSWGPATL